MSIIWKILFVIVAPIALFALMLISSFIFFYARFYIKGYRLKGKRPIVQKRSKFKRIFIDFPKRLCLDIYNRDPFDFREYGLHMFCGEQGSGKTISLVHMLFTLRQKYPKCKISTNMAFKDEDGRINHWHDIVKNTNGTKGQVEVLDEIQTWFSSNQSKKFPPEMLTEVSQQRKQRKMIVGTAQVFSRIAKPIREQTTFVYCPFTILGCLTIVRKTKPSYWNDEKQVFKKYIATYFFIHTDEIRNAFDTYKKIESYKKSGFNDKSILRMTGGQS